MNFRFMRFPEGDSGGLPPTMEQILNGAPAPDKSSEVKDPLPPQDPPGEESTEEEEKPEEEREEESTEELTDDEEIIEFYNTVDKLTGIETKVEYPEGTIPTSPEGVAFREKVIRDGAQKAFESHLRATYPRGYAYLLHLDAGGTDEQFFDSKKGFTLPEVEKLNESADVQTQIYKHDLMSKGLDAESAEILIQKAIKDNKLKDRALESYQKISADQRAQLENLQIQKDREDNEMRLAMESVAADLDETIKTKISLVIPENKQADFKKYVLNNLQYDGENFFILQQLDKKDLKTQVEALLFQYSKGNLDTYVKRKADTKAAQRLRLSVEKTKTGNPRDTGVGSTPSKPITLGDL